MSSSDKRAGSSGVMGYDDFLNHSSGGGGGAFLKSWKEDGSIDVWPHPLAGVAARWAHSFWEVQKIKGKGGEEEKELRSNRWICHERESILRKQRYRTDDIGLRPNLGSDNPALRCGGIVGNGEREMPPEVCPMCILSEMLRTQVRAGRLWWLTPLFEFEIEKGDSEVITVGGFCGLFSRPRNDYSDEQRAQMRKGGIEQDEVFKENASAKLDYLLRVVAQSDPGAGIVIAQVADSLGRKVQKAFKDRIESTKGAFKPSRDHLCLRLKYDEKQDFEKKYDVVALIEEKPSPEVLEAMEQDLPSLDQMLAPGNVKTLRAQMEKACVLKGLPWDQVFGPSEGLEAQRGAEGPGDEPWDQEKKAADQSRSSAQVPANAPAPAAPKPAAPSGPDMTPYACEVCDKDNAPDANGDPPITCVHCGAEYDSFTGAVTYNPKIAPSETNKPRSGVLPPGAVQPPEAAAPPPGKAPARRRRAASG